MLRYLKISNFAIIDNVEVEFREGFNALTGETGAGKSILIGALSILLGVKCSAEIIRAGSEEARVQGLFELPDGFIWPDEMLEDFHDTRELVVTRRINTSGRSRVTVNEHLTSLATLQKLAPHLVNIFGQHESHVLLNPDEHTEILDRCQNLLPLRSLVEESYKDYRECRQEYTKLEKKYAQAAQKTREETQTVEELTNADLKESEEDDLILERDILKKSVQIRERSYEAYQALYGKSGSVIESLSDIKKSLSFLAGANPKLEELKNNFEEASYRLEDVAHELRRLSENVRSDPGTLDRIEERLALIRKLKKKYSSDVPGLLKMLTELSDEAGDLYDLEKSIKSKKIEVDEKTKTYMRHASTLSQSRKSASRELEQAMHGELKALSMPDAKFEVVSHDLEPGQMSFSGLETVEFYLQSNPGEIAKPLSKIASGGELSRLMLALKTLEIGSGEDHTLVFDEVDAGIGGHTAVAVAERLSKISGRRQTLCITHLHQIAALADHHLAVRKMVKDGRTYLEVSELTGEGRVDELTRMLGATSDAQPAREHVKKIMKNPVGGV